MYKNMMGTIEEQPKQKKETDSSVMYSKRMLSNMDMADRSKGEMKEVFTKKWKQDAADLDRYTKLKAMKNPLKNK